MSTVTNKNLVAKPIFIKELDIWHIVPLHRMYDSLSDSSKGLFHPGFLGLDWGTLNVTWLLAQAALVVSCIKPLRKLLLLLCPRTVFLCLMAKSQTSANMVVALAFIKVKRRLSEGGFGGELGIGIADEWQGKGIGSQLMAELLGLAAKENVRKVSLQTRTDNVKAMHLYQRFGFKTIDTLKEGDYWGGQYYDSYLMEREIA